MTTQFTTDYFIAKFKAIPDDQWHTKNLFNENKTKFCALGHCGSDPFLHTSKRTDGCGPHTKESIALISLFSENGMDVTDVNDNYKNQYPGDTPKARILWALNKIKRKQELGELK